MNAGKTILAVLASVATGAAIGVLLAPDRGSDTRRKILRKGEDLSRALNDKIDEKFNELFAAIGGKAKKEAKADNQDDAD
jgi:gas vesicle protein